MRQGFASRLLAMLCDTVIAIAVIGLISAAFTGDAFILIKLADNDPQAERAAESAGWGFAAALILFFLAFWFSEIYLAASPGKLVLGLRIGDENGVRASLRQLIVRWLVKNSGGVIEMIGDFAGVRGILAAGHVVSLAVVMGCFFVLGSSRQALHDKVASTAVFKKSDLRAAAGHGFEVIQPAPTPPPSQESI
jgi:uncharacterized RDD family membrane protein YckC